MISSTEQERYKRAPRYWRGEMPNLSLNTQETSMAHLIPARVMDFTLQTPLSVWKGIFL
jgi:hypothetical protein